MKTYESGTYKVTWEAPSEDEYHTIAAYRNGRVLVITHTRSDKAATWEFNNLCAMHPIKAGE